MRISVIIPTYNNAHIVPRVVESALNQKFEASRFEVIVVDDGSTDDTREKLACFEGNEAYRYLYQENKGRSAARNLGIKEARGEILVFLDSDKVIAENVLAEHLKYQERYQKVAVIGKTLLPDEVLNANLFMKATHEGEVKPRKQRNLQFSYFVTGNLSIAKKLVEDAGGFDEGFSVYGWEDSELGLRLSRMGVELVYNYEIVCYHYHVHDLESKLVNMRKMGRSAWVFCQKEPSLNIRLFLGLHAINYTLCKAWQTWPAIERVVMNKIRKKETAKQIKGLAFLYNLVCQHQYLEGYLEARDGQL